MGYLFDVLHQTNQILLQLKYYFVWTLIFCSCRRWYCSLQWGSKDKLSHLQITKFFGEEWITATALFFKIRQNDDCQSMYQTSKGSIWSTTPFCNTLWSGITDTIILSALRSTVKLHDLFEPSSMHISSEWIFWILLCRAPMCGMSFKLEHQQMTLTTAWMMWNLNPKSQSFCSGSCARNVTTVEHQKAVLTQNQPSCVFERSLTKEKLWPNLTWMPHHLQLSSADTTIPSCKWKSGNNYRQITWIFEKAKKSMSIVEDIFCVTVHEGLWLQKFVQNIEKTKNWLQRIRMLPEKQQQD